ncbi:uncharacterized protein [Henckelia pumila]|uniref:uncharacterized protein n=1 Tax=Henckelia pumila TaxID=405737 RepID=UPI003C6DC8D5
MVVQVELTPATELPPPDQEKEDWRAELLRLKQHSLRFVMVVEVLYKSSFSRPLLKCLKHRRLQNQPVAIMKWIVAACPFDQWGIDIVSPFPPAPAQKKFLLVVVDYFFKWVEAEALARITDAEDLKFLWKNILYRFRVPRKLILDNGRQFQGDQIQAWCKEMKIHHFTSVSYPQSNGKVEVTNRSLVQGLKTRLGKVQGSWG